MNFDGTDPGSLRRAVVRLTDDDPADPTMVDDFEDGTALWSAAPDATLGNPDLVAGSEDALPDQGPFERVLELAVAPPDHVELRGKLCQGGSRSPGRVRSRSWIEWLRPHGSVPLLGGGHHASGMDGSLEGACSPIRRRLEGISAWATCRYDP